ncbi:glycogen synthase [Candidatus Uhrbacteria bacterium]|nr:glycogen synthase [Candidatus Uhrbacteria bacterium]
MKVLFVASELTPIAKVGGLGDVIGALPKALAACGVDVRVALPFYDVIDMTKFPVVSAGSFAVETPVGDKTVDLFSTTIPGTEISVFLFKNDEYLSRDGVYFERSAFVGSFKEIERFLFFSRTVIAWLAQPALSTVEGWVPDVLHCHDWHTGTVPLFLNAAQKNTAALAKVRTLFTIHNLANQGRWNAGVVRNALGLQSVDAPSLAHEHEGDLVLIEQGILASDRVNAVSPTYAQEILTEEYGEGIVDALHERQHVLSGVLNGIDVERWDPATDPDISAHYTGETLDEKKKNKAALLNATGLPVTDAPLLGLVSRLTNQKGIDLILKILERLVQSGARGVFLGTADPKLEAALSAIAKRNPKHLYAKIGFDAVLAQQIYAGADIFLMPSRFEPCGLGQMIAMRYGTLPIVRATGGLKDTVRDGETGFVFSDYSEHALWRVIARALDIYRETPDTWRRMQQNAMDHDFSWNASAQQYVHLYETIISAS